MKKSIREIKNFTKVISKYITIEQKDGKNSWDKNATKFDYAVAKVLSKLDFTEVLTHAVQDTNVEYAEVDAKGILIRDDKGNFTYTKENEKKRIKQIRELEDTLEIEYTPHYITDFTTIAEEDIEALKGFIIE